jgi:hypothetical protein
LNTSEAAYWLGQFAQNQECFATWVSGNHSLHVRITPGTGNAYAIRTAAGNLDLYRNDGSAVTVLTSTPITFTSGDKWGIRAVGSTITAWYAPAGVFPSTPTLTWTDGTYIKPGAIAILCSGTTGSNSVLDDFGGGNVYTKNYPQYFVDGTISTFGLNTVDRVK